MFWYVEDMSACAVAAPWEQSIAAGCVGIASNGD